MPGPIPIVGDGVPIIGAQKGERIEIKLGVDPSKGVVGVEFGKPIQVLAMPPVEMIRFASTLIQASLALMQGPVQQ